MVATTPTTGTADERFASPPASFAGGRWLFHRFTIRDVDALLRIGMVPEDGTFELLDGLIVLKDRAAKGEDARMIGKGHRKCVERFSNLRILLNSPGRHVESQQPLVCAESHMPEPDFVVLRGSLDDYDDRAVAADAFCVVEVADSSYDRDTGPKLERYARAGIRQYIVVDLERRRAEVYTDPDSSAGTYPPPAIIADYGVLSLRVGEDEFFPVPLRDLLP